MLLKEESLEQEFLTGEEYVRFIEGLESAGWSSEKILNFVKWICSGEEKYKPVK